MFVVCLFWIELCRVIDVGFVLVGLFVRRGGGFRWCYVRSVGSEFVFDRL